MSVYDRAFEILSDILKRGGCDLRVVSMNMNKGNASVSMYQTVVMWIKLAGKVKYIKVQDSFITDAIEQSYSTTKIKSDVGLTRIHICSVEDIAALESLVLKIYSEAEMTLGPDPFDCCSRYMECSDEKRCVHEDPYFSWDCTYRIKLLKGMVFFGKNRNVGELSETSV